MAAMDQMMYLNESYKDNIFTKVQVELVIRASKLFELSISRAPTLGDTGACYSYHTIGAAWA